MQAQELDERLEVGGLVGEDSRRQVPVEKVYSVADRLVLAQPGEGRVEGLKVQLQSVLAVQGVVGARPVNAEHRRHPPDGIQDLLLLFESLTLGSGT